MFRGMAARSVGTHGVSLGGNVTNKLFCLRYVYLRAEERGLYMFVSLGGSEVDVEVEEEVQMFSDLWMGVQV
jgi:hypothetical protein